MIDPENDDRRDLKTFFSFFLFGYDCILGATWSLIA